MPHIVGIYSGVTLPKIIGRHSTKLLQKHKGYQFFETQCIVSEIFSIKEVHVGLCTKRRS